MLLKSRRKENRKWKNRRKNFNGRWRNQAVIKQKKKAYQLTETGRKKKRDRRIYEKGAVFESIFTESKNLTKDEFYQLITSLIHKKEANLKILKIIEKRKHTENQNIETQEEETDIEE